MIEIKSGVANGHDNLAGPGGVLAPDGFNVDIRPLGTASLTVIPESILLVKEGIIRERRRHQRLRFRRRDRVQNSGVGVEGASQGTQSSRAFTLAQGGAFLRDGQTGRQQLEVEKCPKAVATKDLIALGPAGAVREAHFNLTVHIRVGVQLRPVQSA